MDPISTHGGITNLAKHIVSVEHGHWNIPDGTILAPIHKRAGAFMLDVIFVNALLSILSGSRVMFAWSLSMWTSADWDHSFAWAIAILFGHFLYWRYTGLMLSRSLGQRLLGLAVVQENGDAMESEDWDQRSVRKLLYLLPVINIWFIVRDVFRMHQRHTHQSEIDLAAGSIVAIANSLPVAHRGPIR